MVTMSPEERQLLEESITLARENNKILRQMRSTMRWNRFWAGLKWLIVIASTLGAYYYLQPYLFKLLDAYQTMLKGLDEVKQVGASVNATLPDLSGLLEGLKGTTPR